MPPKSTRDWRNPPQRGRFQQPGKRQMELMPSVSRSSGLDKDGDALRNFKVQEEYRDFIQTKVEDYWKRFPLDQPIRDTKQRDEVRGNLLILFRKLREGLLSSKRNDAFALEVYETSMLLSIVFSSPVQTTSVISHLIPTVYLALSSIPLSAQTISLLSLLHFLVSGYPSQGRYHEHLSSLPSSLFPRGSPASSWLRDLTRTLRSRNYAALEQLTCRDACERMLATTSHIKPSSDAQPTNRPTTVTKSYSTFIDLPLEASCTLLDALRTKARESTWLVLRSAYRELALHKPTEPDPTSTRVWLCRSLALDTVLRSAPSKPDEPPDVLESWIQERQAQGDLRPKEGVAGRYIVCKPKT